MTKRIFLPEAPISIASKLKNGSKLSTYQQLELSACIRRLNLPYVREHMIKEGMIHPDTNNDFVLGYMHQARLKLLLATDAEKVESETYLRQHGMPVI